MSYPPYYNYGPQQLYAQQGPVMGQAGSNGYPIYAPAATPYAPAATPYMSSQPAPVPFIPPTAMLETPPPSQAQPLQSKSRPKHSHRAATTPLPLKSALKKTAAAAVPIVVPASAAAEPTRRRKTSKKRPDQNAVVVPPQPQPTAEPEESDKAQSYHMFVTFKGDSELLLENTLDHAREEIEHTIFTLWTPGVESSHFRGSNWTIRFKNSPWSMNGPDVTSAWKLIAALFTLFARRGFSFMASTKCTTSHPRLIFQATSIDKLASFFLAYMSRNGRRATLINPPNHIAMSFGPMLRAALPKQVEITQDRDILVAEIKPEVNGTTAKVKPSFFLMQILRVMVDMGFDLNATVPMARGGPLKMGSRRELLVFKGINPVKQ